METLTLAHRLELGPLPPEEAAGVLVRVAERVADWHQRGWLHRGLIADSIFLGSSAAEVDVKEPSAEPVLCGGSQWDSEQTPVELSSGAPVTIPRDLGEARAVLEAARVKLDPRQLDLYQLGVLFNRMLTGESITGYLSSPKVKSRVPEGWRMILDRALGYSRQGRWNSADELIAALRSSESPTQVFRDTSPAENPPSAAEQPLPFSRIGDYEIQGRIGHGGMGDVYRGFDTRLNRTVAIKVLPDELARHTEFVRRFYAEAASAARLVHSNIIEILFVGEEAGRHFFIMEYVAGESLAERLARQKFLSVEEAVSITLQVLAALTAAHEEGFIHRDIKPGNILLDTANRRAVLADFGLVKSLQEGTGLTATGVVVGTVQYISPEQARGRIVDARSDLYSLGVLLYQMLSGELPFTGEGTTALIYQHVYEPPRPLIEVAPLISPALGVIVDKLLSKSPADRYASAALVAADLEAYLKQQPLPSGADIVESDEDDALETDAAPLEVTLIVSAPRFDPPPVIAIPEPVASEPDELPADGGWWQRWQRQLWEAVKDQAPEFAKSLQTTEQQLAEAFDDQERRQRELQQLAKKALRLLQELRQQRSDWQAASERSTEAEEKNRCQQQLTDLAQQIAQQQEQLSEMRLQQAKVSAALERMRSQKDLLGARMKVVESSLKLSGWKRRRRLAVSLLALAGLLGFISLTWIAYDGPSIWRTITGASSRLGKTLQDAALGPMPLGIPADKFEPPQQKLGGIDSAVISIDFGAGGQHLYVGFESGRLGIWDLQTGRIVREQPLGGNSSMLSYGGLAVDREVGWIVFQHQPDTYNATLSIASADLQSAPVPYAIQHLKSAQIVPGKKQLVIVRTPPSPEKTRLELYDVPSRGILRTIAEDVRSASVAPDGSSVAYLSAHDGSLRVWSLEDKLETQAITGATNPGDHVSVSISPNPKWAAIVKLQYPAAPRVSVWDLTSGRKELMYEVRGKKHAGIAFQPGTNFLAVADESAVELWDLESRRVRKVFQARELRQIAFSPDGDTLAGAGGYLSEPYVVVWDAAPDVLATTGNARTLKGSIPAALSGDGRQYASTEGAELVLRNLADEQELQRIKLANGALQSVKLSDDAAYAVAATQIGNRSDRSELHVIDWKAGKVLQTMEGQTQAQFAPSSHTLYFVQNQDLMKLDASRNDVTTVARGELEPCVVQSLAISPSGEQLTICGMRTRTYERFLTLFDLSGSKPPLRIPANGQRWDAARYLPDGTRLAVAHQKHLILLDTESGEELQRIMVGRSYVKAFAFAPTGDRFAAMAGRLAIHATSNGRPSRVFRLQQTAEVSANGVSYTPDGRYLFVPEDGKTILLFDGDAVNDPPDASQILMKQK